MEGSCRLCLNNNVELTSVFEFKDGLEISELVKNICCVEIIRRDRYSKVICKICFETITKANELRILSISNDRLLKKQHNNSDFVVKIETEGIKLESLDCEGNSSCQLDSLKEERSFKCDKCPATKSTKQGIEYHIIQKHMNENICPVCNKSLCSKNILKQHMQRQHSDEVSLKCDQCNEVLKTKKKLELHADVHKYFLDSEGTFTCRFCQTVFKNQLNKMFRHINYHKRRVVKQAEIKKTREESESLVCCHCGKIYRTKQILQQHIKRHFDIGDKYKCQKCPQKFKSWGELFYHNAVHTTERNFICEICSKGFKSKRDLRNHRIRHETKDVKTFQCPHCLIFLKSRYTLNRHILIHTGKLRISYLDQKLSRYLFTGEKPFNCNYCDKAFTQKNELNKHLRIHIGECTYRCEEQGCTEAFRLLAELRLHQEKHYTKISE